MGDEVEVEIGESRYNTQRFRGKVVRVGDTSASVTIDGKKIAVRYFKMVKSGGFRNRESKNHLIRILDPLDLWHEQKPKGVELSSRMYNGEVPTAVVLVEELVHDEELTIEKIREFAAWARRRPGGVAVRNTDA